MFGKANSYALNQKEKTAVACNLEEELKKQTKNIKLLREKQAR